VYTFEEEEEEEKKKGNFKTANIALIAGKNPKQHHLGVD